MNNMPTFNPNAFNPLNIVGNGTQKVQHPNSGYSNTISHNVEGMYKEFTGFHKHLKNLVMLYKTRHQLMESLNENGLYTARCFNEMLHGSPLSAIVTPGGMHENVSEDRRLSGAPSAPSMAEDAPSASANMSTMIEKAAQYEESAYTSNSNRTTQSKSLEERLTAIDYNDDIENIEYPDCSIMREMLEPDEGSRIDRVYSKNSPSQEPEGLKASMKMSMPAAFEETKGVVEEEDEAEENHMQKDPPSADSIVLGRGSSSPLANNYNRGESTDPPAHKPFPDDETEISAEKNPRWKNGNNTDGASDDFGVSVKVVHDDDDSFIGFIGDRNVSPEQNIANDEESMELNTSANYDDVDKDREQKLLHAMMLDGEENNKEDAVVKNLFGEDEFENVPFPAIAIDDPGIGHLSTDEDTRSSQSTNDGEGNEKEYLNISSEGELVVMKSSPENTRSHPTSPPPKPKNDYSYFDVHKAAYKETNSKLDEQFNIVQYVEEWERTVLTRVQSRYFEYVKHRNSLNHYAKKVDSLLDEEEKLRLKNKPMKPKQKEKLERNQVKLTGSRETHDSAGESLLMLMDEVIIRSWRDAFPLLKKSIGFECDFAAIQHKHMANLSRSVELLEVIGEKESVSMDGRLELFRDMNPEDMYTGSRDKIFAEGR